jgi:hypothetical protein
MDDSRALVKNIKSKIETAPQIDQALVFLDLILLTKKVYVYCKQNC